MKSNLAESKNAEYSAEEHMRNSCADYVTLDSGSK